MLANERRRNFMMRLLAVLLLLFVTTQAVISSSPFSATVPMKSGVLIGLQQSTKSDEHSSSSKLPHVFVQPPSQKESLKVVLNLVDGTRQPLGGNVPVHIEIDNPYEGNIARRDANGPSHQFDGLPWHGNAAAKVSIRVVASGYLPASKELPEVIRGTVQQTDMMLISERNETRVYSWATLQQCCSDVAQLFSNGLANGSDPQSRYDSFAQKSPIPMANALSGITLLRGLGLFDDIKAIDLDSDLSERVFTIWADANVVQRWRQVKTSSWQFKFGEGPVTPWDSNTVDEVYYLKWRIDSRRATRDINGITCVPITVESKPFSLKLYVRLWDANRSFNPPLAVATRTNATFFEAAIDGNVAAIKNYLSTGTDIESENGTHETALELAAKNGREETVEFLLASGANPNHHAPLVIAAEKGNQRMVRALMAGGANRSQKRDGFTPLLAACREGNREIVDYFLSAGASVKEKTDSGMSTLEVAAKAGKTEVAETLLSHGANANTLLSAGVNDGSITVDDVPIDFEGMPILVLAAFKNNLGLIEALLRHGADPNAQEGVTLTSATLKGYTKIAVSLLNHGADPNLGKTGALFLAAADGYTEIVRALLDHGAKVSGINSDQPTPLMVASFRGHTEIVNLLLAKGADVNTKVPKYGITALIAAAREGTPEVVQALLARGADRSVRVEGKTALDFATEAGNREAAAVLRDKTVKSFTLQRDFTYSEVGKNPAALRRELLESFLFYDIELLEHSDTEGKSLQLSDSTKNNLNAEVNFMLENILKLYKKNRERISKYLNGVSLPQLTVSVKVTDEGLAYAQTVPPAGADQPGTISIDAKLLRVNMAASVANSFKESSGNSDVDKLREIQRQVRNHVYTGPGIESNGPGSFKGKISSPDQLGKMFDQLGVYTELLDLDQEVKAAETQYYGTILFVLTHELGHLVLGHHAAIDSVPKDKVCELRQQMELQADQFSALLLGSSFIALSVNVLPVEMPGLGKSNMRFLDTEMLQRYVGYSLFLGKAYERLGARKPEGDDCYPGPEARLKTAGLAIKSIRDSEGDSIVNKIQRRQDIKDAVRSAFGRRYGLITDMLR
jgi:uncharacterized protein